MIRTTLIAVLAAVALAEGAVLVAVAQAQHERTQAERSQWVCLRGDKIATPGSGGWDRCERVAWRKVEW